MPDQHETLDLPLTEDNLEKSVAEDITSVENGTSQASPQDAPVDSKDSHHMEQEFPSVLPVLAVRDVVVFNYMILPLFIGRDKSVRAVEAALDRGRHCLLTCCMCPTSTP